ncbi:MAG: TonB-dependent receptor [Halioglobus sp.]|nr:TonB-dependent receptor [Halioglobus sp.]
MNKNAVETYLFAGLVTSLLWSAQAVSQTEPAGAATRTGAMLEEVIVTARRREESLQETPVAVSAFSAEDLTEAGISTITDLQQSVPSLQFAQNGGKNSVIFIRGIGQREGSAVLDPGVGVYINDIFIPRSDAQVLDTVDTESIQVLRGPQGTLFGKNTTGGAILVTTREPDFEAFETTLTTRLGNFGRRDGMLRGNIPLIEDSMGLRYAVNRRTLDGYLDNVLDGKEFGDEDRWAVTGRLLWDVSDNFSADLFAYWSRQRERSVALSCLFQNPESNLATLVTPGGPPFEEACRRSEALASDEEVSVNTADSVFEIDSSILALTLNWYAGDLHIKSVTGFSYWTNIESNNDQDGSQTSLINNGTRALNKILRDNDLPIEDEDRYQVSQELQLHNQAFDGRLQYTLGLFGSLEKINDNPFTQLIGPGGLQAVPFSDDAVLPFPTALANRSDLENLSLAVFAQGTYDINEWLQLTVGGRYTYEDRERDMDVFEVDLDTYCPRLGNSVSLGNGLCSSIPEAQFAQFADSQPPLPVEFRPSADKRSEEFDQFTPSVTLSYIAPQVTLDRLGMQNFMSYFTVSQGFKAGGFEPRGDELVPFEPEEVTNFEIGTKMDALDRRLRFNAAVYHLMYDDIQVRVAEQGERITDIFLFLSNAGEAQVTGAEMEATLLLGDWVFNASAAYTDAEYDEFDGQVVDPLTGQTSTVDRSDEEFALVPETTYSLAVQYNWMSPVGLIAPRLSYYFRDEIFTGIDERAIDFDSSTIDTLNLVNARLSWLPAENFRASAFVDNLLDESYFASGFTVSAALGAATLLRGQPRTYGLELSYTF